MKDETLPSIDYAPTGEMSLYERWERRLPAPLVAPIAVRDSNYRQVIASILRSADADRAEILLSVGAGNGFTEALLSQQGWQVLATDCSAEAEPWCRAKGLEFQLFCLGADSPPRGAPFGAVLCDGVLGHLWQPTSETSGAWRALRALTRDGGVLVVSNDLSSGTDAQFEVRGHPEMAFYRPCEGDLGATAEREGWRVGAVAFYDFNRGGPRRREILTLYAY